MLTLRHARPLYSHRVFSTSSRTTTTGSLSPWRGLDKWRKAPPSELRHWGPDGPIEEDPSSAEGYTSLIHSASSLAELGFMVLSTPDPVVKSKLSHLAFSSWRSQNLPVGHLQPPDHPSRPSKPILVLSHFLHFLNTTLLSTTKALFFPSPQVSTKQVPSPKNSGLPLNAYLLHNLAHVELNAIDLAWDTVLRFSSLHDTLGDGFFDDFARVADDESRHFGWCSQRLSQLGFKYGDMPAHNLLWKECEKTSNDISARLAAIPLVQEARGLDAGPRLVQKLIGCGDKTTSEIVARIAEEEIAHVAIGVHWFDFICKKLNRVPDSTFNDLLEEYGVEPKGPFNYLARDEAGIPRHWYEKSLKPEVTNALSEAHDRLAYIVSMEKENSSLNS